MTQNQQEQEERGEEIEDENLIGLSVWTSFRFRNSEKSWARGFRIFLERPKSLSKSDFRNFSLKSCEEYLVYWSKAVLEIF